MWLPALLAPLAAFVLVFTLLRRQRRRPAPLSVALAVALTVCVETVLLNGLSPFRAVARGPLLVAHAALAVAAAAVALRTRGGGRALASALRPLGKHDAAAAAVVAVLALPIAYSALSYVPNNWDSMTYHLARVAHWIQQRSVAPFDTNVPRQVKLPAGAEYLLLVLQAIAGSDRLASLVQFASWLVVALAASPLARTFGVPRTVAPWTALLFAAAPMAVLQASSTQNDLVASAVAVAVVVGCVPFLHRRACWRGSDVIILAGALSAALLVKPTVLVVTAPFVAWAAVATTRARARGGVGGSVAPGRRGRGLVAAALLVLVVVAPEAARRKDARDEGEFAPFLYPPLSEGTDRAVNVVRGFARHVPLPFTWTTRLAAPETRGCTVPGSMCAHVAERANEDLAGNPRSAVVSLALIAVAVGRWRSVPARGRAAIVTLVAGWLLFGATFRDNIWISRLHLPLFALSPVAAAALAGTWSRHAVLRWAAPLLALALFAQGWRAACRNELRSAPNEIDRSLGLLPGNYYAARRELWPNHVLGMRAIASSGCRRLGLYIGGDSYDYPITWRAMLRGIAVRHLVRPDDWACAVWSDRGDPPPSPGGAWCPVPSAPMVFLREGNAASDCTRGHDPGVEIPTR